MVRITLVGISSGGTGWQKGGGMAEIQIDAAKAERMIAQILRDEGDLFPTKANTLAANICRRLWAAMPVTPRDADHRQR